MLGSFGDVLSKQTVEEAAAVEDARGEDDPVAPDALFGPASQVAAKAVQWPLPACSLAPCDSRPLPPLPRDQVDDATDEVTRVTKLLDFFTDGAGMQELVALAARAAAGSSKSVAKDPMQLTLHHTGDLAAVTRVQCGRVRGDTHLASPS